MSVYDDIRAKIELLGGAQGPKGSFNHQGGKEIVINYDTPSGIEAHHVVPFLIGQAPNTAGSGNVDVLLAFKYKGPAPHTAIGWRCYKVSKITLSSPPPIPDPRPGASVLPKLKLKRQSCVDDW